MAGNDIGIVCDRDGPKLGVVIISLKAARQKNQRDKNCIFLHGHQIKSLSKYSAFREYWAMNRFGGKMKVPLHKNGNSG
jgi:hypothetical protein